MLRTGSDMDEAGSVNFSLSVDQSDADADDIDLLAEGLAAQLRAEDISAKPAAGQGKLPEGARAGEALSVGQIIVEIAPIAIPALAGVLHTWISATTKRRKIVVKVGDSSVELDSKTTPADYLTRLGQLARSLRPK